ncbi:hypothetical protein ABIE61_003255 [Marinobacterium sp. MBR-111]
MIPPCRIFYREDATCSPLSLSSLLTQNSYSHCNRWLLDLTIELTEHILDLCRGITGTACQQLYFIRND